MIKSEKLMILLSLMLNVSNGIMAMDRLSDEEELDTSNKVESCPRYPKYQGRRSFIPLTLPERPPTCTKKILDAGEEYKAKPRFTPGPIEIYLDERRLRIISKNYLNYRITLTNQLNELLAVYRDPESDKSGELRLTKKQIQTFIDDIARENVDLTGKERTILQNALNKASE